ncbi:MAG: thioredoxin domain-containing protein [Alphaproteobacteria bacterium]|nr:thioredoxin domain-containing protein [Alphaproteobacteria bacterium]MBQ8660288.1 thioredoxin domain-containing protein [Alphaproteobacteria bacterium]
MKVSKEIISALEKDKVAPIIGNPNGKTIIYEFFDYNCGHCKNQNIIMNELIQANKDIKIILKNFPIFPVSHLPAKATVAAQKQGKTFLLHKSLFENHLLPFNYSEIGVETLNKKILDKVLSIAKKIGLNIKKLENDMCSEEVEKEIDITKKIAHQLNIHGTPAIIIKDKVFPGFMDIAEIKEAIK